METVSPAIGVILLVKGAAASVEMALMVEIAQITICVLNLMILAPV